MEDPMEALCTTHATVAATGTCDDCKRPICAQCTKGTLDGLMCPTCAARRYGRRAVMTWVKIGGIAALVTGVAVVGLVLASRGNDKPAAGAAGANGPQGEQDPYIELLRKERDKAPCDMTAVRKLVKELNEMKRHAEAVDDANRYFEACAPFPRLKWDAIYALQQLGRYPEAVKLETELLAEDPHDSDFWWWRGEDRSHGGESAQALADFRQSFANSKGPGYSRFPAGRIMDVVEPAGRPCEGVAALNYFVAFHGGTLSGKLERQAADLDVSARCGTRRGDGTFQVKAGAEPARIKVTVGGVEGTFAVEPSCGTTAVSAAFAQRAQLARSGPAVDTVALGAIRTGPLATADLVIDTAKAPATELAIVDELPGVDGVIGLSALWKFELVRGDDGALIVTGTGK